MRKKATRDFYKNQTLKLVRSEDEVRRLGRTSRKSTPKKEKISAKKSKATANVQPLSSEKRKRSNPEPAQSSKKVKLSTFSPEEVTIDVLNNDIIEITVDENKPIITEIHHPLGQNNIELKAQESLTLGREDNSEARRINVNNLPTDTVITFMPSSTHDRSMDVSISIPADVVTRLQTKKEPQGGATSKASIYKSTSSVIELNSINIKTELIQTRKADKKATNLKTPLSLKKNNKAPRKINKKTEKMKNDKGANKNKYEKANKKTSKKETKKEKGRH
jgi:hypothetical protein